MNLGSNRIEVRGLPSYSGDLPEILDHGRVQALRQPKGVSSRDTQGKSLRRGTRGKGV